MDRLYTGRTHCHSDNSVKDALCNVNEMAAKAKELSYDALALTDHGTVSGWWSFAKACKKNDIKPLFGCEMYVKKNLSTNVDSDEDDENISHVAGKADARLHMIVLAKDNIGLHAISLMVTEANKHIERRGKKNIYPCVDKNIIEQFIGPDTEAHGHVIVTSACIGGILAGLVFQNDAYIAEAEKLTRALDDADAAKKCYDSALTDFEAIDTERTALKAVKDKKYGNRIRAINKREDGPEKEQALQEVAAEQAETNHAIEVWDEISDQYAKAKKVVSECRARLMDEVSYQTKTERLAYLKSEIMDKDRMVEKLENEALYFDAIAGHGNFYIELQYHGSENEAKWMPVLDELAARLSIPTVAANDEHMLNKEDVEARKYLNAMRWASFNYEAPEDADKELYFKTDDELREILCKCLPAHRVELAMQGISNIIEACNAELVSGKHYPKYNNAWTKEQADAYLEQVAREGIPARYAEWTQELEDRFKYELGIIQSMGYTDYFLIVQWYINVGRKLGHMPAERLAYLKEHVREMNLDAIMAYVEADQSAPGLAVGPGRGSGAGSIVCYLTGITSIDPIKNQLVFERFLNPERVSMPDIDVDFAQFIRDVLIDVVKAKFGQDGVCMIMTRGTLAAKAAIQMVAKVQGSKVNDDSKSLIGLGAAMSKLIPEKPGSKIADAEEEIIAQFGKNKNAMEILTIAKKLEGVYNNTGQHAAGVVIADNGDIKQYTPLMWDIDNGGWKSQMDKDEIEKNGMLKMDFLGLINLDIITETLRMMERRGKSLGYDVEQLPIEPEVIRLFADAKTNSIFQFEGEGMRKMLSQFGPTTFEDLVLLVAAYRPGPMQFLPEVFNVKHGAQAKYLTKELVPILQNTYGQIIYQEQVMEIFRRLAGYSLGGADLVRRAMGHKEMELLQREREAFVHGDSSRNITGCVANGIDEKAANKLFDQMMKFAEYAFNKAHAAAYSAVSYITAYLKYHFTTEYLCTVIQYESDLKKIPAIIRDCKENHIRVHNPSINFSIETPSIHDEENIYFGLESVKGVKQAGSIIEERNRGGNFTSVGDFVTRTQCNKGVLESLAKAGAFDDLYEYRSDIVANAAVICKAVKDAGVTLEDLKKKYVIEYAMENGDMGLAVSLNDGKKPVAKVLAASIARLEKKMAEIRSTIEGQNVHYGKENLIARLNAEKEVLGVYVSGSPLDGYRPVATYQFRGRDRQLPDLNSSYNSTVSILAYPINVEHLTTKKDKKPFITFFAETPLGELNGVCFNEDCIRMFDDMKEPCIFKGKIKEDRENADEVSMSVFEVLPAEREYVEVTAMVPNVGRWCDICSLTHVSVNDGNDRKIYHITAWHDTMLDERRDTDVKLSQNEMARVLELKLATFVPANL